MNRVEMEIDPITLEIYWSRLISIMDEADNTLGRTAFSTIIAESRDYAIVLLDETGVSLAQSVPSSTLFTVMLPRAAHVLLEHFPPETLEPGDVLLTNDPWIGTGHTPDLVFLRPLFNQSRLVAHIACVAHFADIGGTLSFMDGRDVFEEGLRLTPCKVYRAGRPNEDILQILGANVRVPYKVLGDVQAVQGAMRVAELRLEEFLQDYRLSDLRGISRTIQRRSEQAMRQALATIPSGTYHHTVTIDGIDEPLTIQASVTIRGDEMLVDFAGTSPETRRGAINSVYNATVADTLSALKCALVPDLPNNEGLYRPIAVVAPEGSILNCRFPAPVRARSDVCFHTHEAVYGALAQVIPERVQAGTGLRTGVWVSGQYADGTAFNGNMSMYGGIGAAGRRDGLAATAFPTTGHMVSAEIFEHHVPLYVVYRALRPGSAGDGRFRGGLGMVAGFRVRGNHTVTVSLRRPNWRIPAPGLLGGAPGQLSRQIVNGAPSLDSVVTLGPSDFLQVETPGGGGFGPPHERPDVLRRHDQELGLMGEPTVVRGRTSRVRRSAASKRRR